MDKKVHNLQKSQLKRYKKEFDYSYTLGPFPTFELMGSRENEVICIYIDPDFTDREEMERRCKEKGIMFEIDRKVLSKISDKENCYAAGVFKKYSCTLDCNSPHVVLVNPSDMGNLGTIIRTLVGLGVYDLAIIEPAADIFSPKTVRSSMGSLFKMRFERFKGFYDYLEKYGDRDIFPFMLDGKHVLSLANCPRSEKYSLVFGNEARGLDSSFAELGTSIFIPQSSDVDSLNLAISVGIGTFVFTSCNRLRDII